MSSASETCCFGVRRPAECRSGTESGRDATDSFTAIGPQTCYSSCAGGMSGQPLYEGVRSSLDCRA